MGVTIWVLGTGVTGLVGVRWKPSTRSRSLSDISSLPTVTRIEAAQTTVLTAFAATASRPSSPPGEQALLSPGSLRSPGRQEPHRTRTPHASPASCASRPSACDVCSRAAGPLARSEGPSVPRYSSLARLRRAHERALTAPVGRRSRTRPPGGRPHSRQRAPPRWPGTRVRAVRGSTGGRASTRAGRNDPRALRGPRDPGKGRLATPICRPWRTGRARDARLDQRESLDVSGEERPANRSRPV